MLSQEQKRAIERLTALWALSESGLGGIMHAIKIPFTGLIVGGIAVIIVSLICVLGQNKWKIVAQSLLTVLAIKLAISPHASFTAYFAVSFQAVAAWLFFKFIKNKNIAAFLTTVICMLESALQKLIVLTIFYGKDLWEAVDRLGDTAVKELGLIMKVSSSEVLILTYIGIYGINGILLGKFLSGILRQDLLVKREIPYLLIKPIQSQQSQIKEKPKHWVMSLWRPRLFQILLFVVLILILLGNRNIDGIWKYILRVFLIFLFWFGILGPVIKLLLEKYLSRKESYILAGTENAFKYFPYLRQIIQIAWKNSMGMTFKRIPDFLEKLILYTLYFDIDEEKNNPA